MAVVSQALTANARFLRTKATRHAYIGMAIAIVAILAATLLVAWTTSGAVTLDTVVAAQRENPSLWILDAMPFAFAIWGQYVSSMMAFEASAMIIDQTSELRAQTAVLEHQATRNATMDTLTDLPNRVLLRDRLEQALTNAARDRSSVAVMIMDLDRFKEINDTLGHYTGDRILKQVATRLRGIVQSPATLSRLGGDEFAIVLPEIARAEDAEATALKIDKALHAPFMLEGLTIDVQGSVGVAVYPEHGTDADTLLQRADVAMYVAKKQQKGHAVYSASLDQYSPHRLTLMGELRQAIERDDLLLHYHPKVDLRTDEINEVEALVRWNHPRHGMMAPDEFIPLAERTGLIKPLTLWVLDRALRQYSEWRERGIDVAIAINLSANGLLDQELPDSVAGAMAAHDIPPNRLSLEITESMLITDTDRAMDMLTRLAAMNVQLSIDDFGTGYSSLAYLSRLPVRALKIDKSFVADMENNPRNAMIVHATIELAHNLGLEVIGEGVEDEATFDRLKTLGCDVIQGYFVTPPIAGDAFADWFEARGGSVTGALARRS